ncbi:MAG TPA: manganese transporter [Cytophagales bacterium]|nr:manganese transporter [Cytophagales bacterium]HAA23630.1 manganese transporter [Cytophagales bacterium]HAP65353.1 manganese transporter [Cytophagales bacterium]
MNISKKIQGLILLFLATITLGCGGNEKESSNRLKVVTTTGMLGDAVRNIVGDSAEVVSLMGPGVDPHLYKATQGDLTQLNRADLIIYNGLFLEGKMGDVFSRLQRTKPIVAAAENLDSTFLLSGDAIGKAIDPHVWFDVSLWRQVVLHLGEVLAEQSPELAEYFQDNAKQYAEQLVALDEEVATAIATIPEGQRVLITAHDAFGYFGNRYQIEVEGLQGISTLSEPGIRDVTELVDLITERKIKAVFVETSVSDKSIQAVVTGCRERGHEVSIGGSLFSDAMGAEDTPEGTYPGMVRSNVRIIVDALH